MTQNKQCTEQHRSLEECGPCPISAGYTLAFALQLREKARKNLSQDRKPQLGYRNKKKKLWFKT
jgi:hypothetical protein